LNTTQKRRKSNSSYICSPIDYHHTITSLYIKEEKGKDIGIHVMGMKKVENFLCLGENLGTQKDRRITNWKAISTVEEN